MNGQPDDLRILALTADEPQPPADGTCAVCGKPRHPERSSRYAHGCAEIDPFCSTSCARRFHNNPCPEAAGGNLGYTANRVRSWEHVSGAERKRQARAKAREAA